jgi:hypothetical protein
VESYWLERVVIGGVVVVIVVGHTSYIAVWDVETLQTSLLKYPLNPRSSWLAPKRYASPVI